jgi:hypothetical protein
LQSVSIIDIFDASLLQTGLNVQPTQRGSIVALRRGLGRWLQIVAERIIHCKDTAPQSRTYYAYIAKELHRHHCLRRTLALVSPLTSDYVVMAGTQMFGAKMPELAKVLCQNSAADVDCFIEKFDLDLNLRTRLGGHSQPRTHRGVVRFHGMTITYAMIQMLDMVTLKTNRARIITNADVFQPDLKWQRSW